MVSNRIVFKFYFCYTMFINRLILFSPIQFLSTYAVKFLVKRLGLHNLTVSLITALYLTARSTVSKVDIIPTFRVLIALRDKLIKGSPTLKALEENLHNPALVEIIRVITPHIDEIIKKTKNPISLR